MSEVKEYKRRDLPAVTEPPPTDPDVIAFLNRFAATDKENKELKALIDKQDVAIAAQGHRIEYQDSVIKTLTHQRDTFQRGYLEMRAEVSILGSAAINCLEKSNQALARDGINPELPKPDALDDGAAEIGKKFGAGT